ncbi:hypothetical protein DL769_001668 [Monosporascus sp. CRB-8-3]|nr:hypothetical protein DL769_001668 [Monosporascus sp. CRB-8-3]
MADFQSSIGFLRQSPVASTEELPTPGDSRGSSVYNLPTDNSIHLSKVAYPDLIEEASPGWIDEKSIRIAQKTDNGQWGLVGRKPKNELWKIAREKILRLLERYEEILQGLPADYEGYHRCADNVRTLTAALFYTFAFQLADIIAPRGYWHLEYTELKRRLAGLGLQARVFLGELQLRYRRVYKEELMQQFSPVHQEMLTEYRLVVMHDGDEDDKYHVVDILDVHAVYRPLSFKNQPAPVGHPPEGMEKSTAEGIQMVHSLVQMMGKVLDDSKERNIEDYRAKEWKLFTKLYSTPQYIHKDNNQEYERVWKQFKPRA